MCGRLVPLTLVAGAMCAAETLALVGGTVWRSPVEEPLRRGTVVMEDGRITRVDRAKPPRNARVIDCRGLTVMAGFWNSHVHFFQRKWENAAQLPAAELEQQLEGMTTRYGFTSVFDLGSLGANTRAIRERIERGEVRGPRIRTTGEVILAPGAFPPANVLRALGSMPAASFEVIKPEDAAAAARAIVAAGADGVKVHLQRPLPEEVIRAAVEVAHAAGKPVFVHPSTRADLMASARAAVDVLAHNTPFSPWDVQVVPLMKARGVAITPTLAMWRFQLRHERASLQERAVREAVAQLRSWVSAGGEVLFGNDLGAVEYDPTEEYELMSRAGMSFRQILTALTTAPAERFARGEKLGRLAAGYSGDVVMVAGDPSRDVRALAAVRYTIRSGRVIFGS